MTQSKQNKMNKDDFLLWKETNQWFWDYLVQTADEFQVGLDGIGQQMTHPNADLELLKTRAIEIQAMIDNMRQITTLEWPDVCGRKHAPGFFHGFYSARSRPSGTLKGIISAFSSASLLARAYDPGNPGPNRPSLMLAAHSRRPLGRKPQPAWIGVKSPPLHNSR